MENVKTQGEHAAGVAVLAHDLDELTCAKLRFAAEEWACTVSVMFNGRCADTNMLKGLMNLDARTGDTVHVQAHGNRNAARALADSLRALRAA